MNEARRVTMIPVYERFIMSMVSFKKSRSSSNTSVNYVMIKRFMGHKVDHAKDERYYSDSQNSLCKL